MKHILLSISMLSATTALADEAPFGTYGYRHQEMHDLGVIQDLITRSGQNCCDGGMGGECRVTQISTDGKFYRYNEQWCPLSTTTDIRTDVRLPAGVGAMYALRTAH